MERTFLPIKDAAKRCSLSQLQIWILVRMEKINYKKEKVGTLVNFSDIRLWLIKNGKLAYDMSLPVDLRDPNFSLFESFKSSKNLY